jgi:hypothetical protein
MLRSVASCNVGMTAACSPVTFRRRSTCTTGAPGIAASAIFPASVKKTLPSGLEPLKRLQVPEEVVSQIVATLCNDRQHAVGKVEAERSRLEARLTGIRNRMDGAYTDKLDGKIPEDFWERKMTGLADGRTPDQNGYPRAQ